MIKKRKIRKIIEVKRRNPSKIHYDDFLTALFEAFNENLIHLIIIYRQGYLCEDCNNKYYSCECEKCENCWEKRCMCPLEDEGVYDYARNGRNKIRKIMWEFARYYYTHKDLENIVYLISKHTSIMYEDQLFLKSLTPNSKFPEYTKLMKRLFEID